VILQASAQPDEVAVFLYDNGRLRGPAGFSTVGMRIQNEQSGSTSLFAQPMALEPIPERPALEVPALAVSAAPTPELRTPESPAVEAIPEAPVRPARGVLEARMEEALAALTEPAGPPSSNIRQGHLALLKRWYYRPEVRRTGEIFFPDDELRWPVKAMLRGVGRVFAAKIKSSGFGS
jgi:hypothetical protein